MKSINHLLAAMGRWAVTVLFCVSAIAFTWQGAFLSNNTAMAAPGTLVIAARTDAGDQIQQDNKSFVQNAAEKVKDAARSNANRVEDATDNDGSFIERKAQRDANRIEQRANEDAARTQRAIDNNVNAVERAVDSIKDVFSK
ncbi:MAG: hypothetical protein HC899_12585 [Leptolyngbyaceae cyanobacterium SM1_4_3]|nr:hypothetical protein [Leptolyngbyaceae cyanobacterium SM1_4_3]NJN90833.1 hypothetical protein [Leptolyngbyaceae cyanobacterium SL_5_14]